VLNLRKSCQLVGIVQFFLTQAHKLPLANLFAMFILTVMSVIEQKESTKDLIVDAAIEVFGRSGFQKARVSDIVGLAGVAQGTFYLYFPSKEAVFRHICSIFMERFTEVFRTTSELFEGATEKEIESRVADFIRELLVIYKDNRKIAEILFREGIGHGGLFKEIYEDIYLYFLKLIEERIKVGRGRGILGFPDPKKAAVFMLGLFERSVFYFLSMNHDLDEEALSRAMASFILHGLSLEKST
jgi:AcrR family transcriptional regulator